MNDLPTLFEPNYLNLEYFYDRIYRLLTDPGVTGGSALFVGEFWFWFKVLSYSASVLFVLAIVYLFYQISVLRHEEARDLASLFDQKVKADKGGNEEWQKVLRALESENPADWKVAIIEADNILDKMVKAMQYPGDNLGERLKAIEVSDFTTLEAAWDAHKVRNRIAHESAFVLTKREARRVISLFEVVFKEFDYI
ncbi:MAG: hypothetical protein AAB589_01325 [Patescibacteria group bacterium]